MDETWISMHKPLICHLLLCYWWMHWRYETSDCFHWTSTNDITNLTNPDPTRCTTFTSQEQPIGSQLAAQVNIDTECFVSANHITVNITSEGLTSCNDLDDIVFAEYQTSEPCHSLHVYKCVVLNPMTFNMCSLKCPCGTMFGGRCTLDIVFTSISKVSRVNLCSMTIGS